MSVCLCDKALAEGVSLVTDVMKSWRLVVPSGTLRTQHMNNDTADPLRLHLLLQEHGVSRLTEILKAPVV